MGVDINFIDYFVHKTVKSQLSPHLPYKDFEVLVVVGGGEVGGLGGGGRGIRGMKKGFLLSQY